MGLDSTVKMALVAVGLIALAIIARNCRKSFFPPTPRPPASWKYAVDSVPTGNTIVVKTGMLERRRATITLADLAVPAVDAPLGEESRRSLEVLAGSTVRVEFVRGRLRNADPADYVSLDAIEARDRIAVVYAETGTCCNLEQLFRGLAKNTGSRKGWKAAEAEAKKQGLGLWNKARKLEPIPDKLELD